MQRYGRDLCFLPAAVAQRAVVIFNSRSGNSAGQAELSQAIRAARLDADIIGLETHGDVLARLKRVADSYDVLVAAGGDGTVSIVAATAVRQGKTLAVIPGGTLNHFARDAGIPLQLERAVAVLADGYTRSIDVAVVNGLTFVNNASIGAYPRLVWERSRARHSGWPRPLAVGFAAVRTWADLRSISVRISVDEMQYLRQTPFVFVGNGEYEVEGTQFGSRPTLTDGKLSLYLTPESGRFGVLMLPIRALVGTLKRHDKFETYTATSISIETGSARTAVALDGEIRMLESPLRFSLLRQALRAIVPAAQR